MRSRILEDALEAGFLSLDYSSPKDLQTKASDAYLSWCADKWPYVIVVKRVSTASVEMDTVCFDPSELDEQALMEMHALIANIAGDLEFPCGRNFFKAERVPINDAPTLARAFVNVALRAKSRSSR